MIRKNFLQILFPFGLVLLLFFYLSAPFPNDSPGCCSAPASNWLDLPNYTSCNTPESSSCTKLKVYLDISMERLCAIYFPKSNPVDNCSKTSSVATCSINDYSLKKIYYTTGSTPWDKNSAGIDCSNLGGTLE